MADTFIPGVLIVEIGDEPLAATPGSSFSGLIARAKRGRDNQLRFLSNLEQYKRIFGGPDANHPYGYESVEDYFNEGGNALYFARVIGAGAASASVDIDTIEDTNETTLTLSTSSEGSWGNNTFVTTTKWKTTLAAATPGGTNTAQLTSIIGVEIGDVIDFNDGVDQFTDIVVSIDTPTKTITTRNNTIPLYATPANCIVSSTSTHKVKTVLATDITEGSPAQIQVASSASIDIGALLLVVSSTLDRVLECKVTAKNGNILSVTTLLSDGATLIPTGSVVVSTNFDIIYNVDDTPSAFNVVNLEDDDVINYVETVLLQSEYLRAQVGVTTINTYKSFTYPTAVSTEFLTGGLDGAAPTSSDYLGTNVNKNYTHGVKLLDAAAVVAQFGTPETTVEVFKGYDAYAQNRADTFHVGAAPLTYDTLEELQNYRNVELNVQSSYSGLYAPWGIKPDPLTPGAKLSIAPVGAVLGKFSEVATRRGTQKPPANEVLRSFIDVTAVFEDEEYGILNGIGVNLIRNISGQGIRIKSARTLWPNQDRFRFINVRRILNAIKIALKQYGATIEQEPNDVILWAKIEKTGQSLLNTLWKQKWLFPSDDPTQAYFFRCDRVTNTEELRQNAQVRAVLGINPVLPAELIKFELSLYSGGEITINQLAA